MKFPFEIAALVVSLVLVACCVAPAFMAGFAATSLGWVAGFNALEIKGVALETTVLVFAFTSWKTCKIETAECGWKN